MGELRIGIEDLLAGKRRSKLEVWLEKVLPEWFAANLLPVTKEIADRWGKIAFQAKRKGMILITSDDLIAATVMELSLTLVTRNVKDFVGLEVQIVKPWDESARAVSLLSGILSTIRWRGGGWLR